MKTAEGTTPDPGVPVPPAWLPAAGSSGGMGVPLLGEHGSAAGCAHTDSRCPSALLEVLV